MESVNQDKKIAQVVADFIVDQKFEALPKETINKGKEFILDAIGCIVGASERQQAQILVEVMEAEGGAPRSSVIARGFKTSVMNAALINGTMAHMLDFDDDHREGIVHPSAVIFPAVFPVAESVKASGKNLLRAFILGSEVMIRVGEAYLGQCFYQGFHPTGTVGVFGAAAGAASLLGLDAKQTTYALGLAGSFMSGTFEWQPEGTWQKPLQAGHPAMFGVLSAFLGKKNFVGARTIFEGRSGVIRAYSYKDQYDCALIAKDLGKKWEMKDTSIKVHACCRFLGPVADCAMDLYRRGVRAKDVKGILAKVDKIVVSGLCEPRERKIRPQTHVDAQFSLQYVAAVALCKNRAGADEFRLDALKDPDVLKLAEKVTYELDPAAEAVYPKAYPATLVVTLNDGRTLESHLDYPKGDPENPATKEEVVDKFNALTKNAFDQKRQAKIVKEIDRLEEIDDVSKLADLLR